MADDVLTGYRKSIDNIDAALVHLLAERFKVTQAVGRHKATAGLPPADPGREERQIARLRQQWRGGQAPSPLEALLGPAVDELDRFDRVQLEEVVRVCLRSKNLSAAGRELFAVSRTQRASTNDADRLRKYLARFDLSWTDVMGDR